jgi:hypothetical protein
MPVLAHEHGTAERVFSPSECTKNIGFLWVYMFTARIFKEVTGFRKISTSGMAGMPALAGKHHRGIARLIEEIIHKKISS